MSSEKKNGWIGRKRVLRKLYMVIELCFDLVVGWTV